MFQNPHISVCPVLLGADIVEYLMSEDNGLPLFSIRTVRNEPDNVLSVVLSYAPVIGPKGVDAGRAWRSAVKALVAEVFEAASLPASKQMTGYGHRMLIALLNFPPRCFPSPETVDRAVIGYLCAFDSMLSISESPIVPQLFAVAAG